MATLYEMSWKQDDQLMIQLEDFGNHEPACLVWRRNGRWSKLFLFLAARFLGASDSVLDCERFHARWQWVCNTQRSIRFRLLNALLKMKMYLERMGTLPAAADLHRVGAVIRAGEQAVYNEVARDPNIDPRMRSMHIWQDRFNIGPDAIELIKEAILAEHVDSSSPETAWGQYVRWLFVPGRFYQLANASDMLVFIAENKSLPNRRKRRDSEAIGRSLAVAFFNAVDVAVDGQVINTKSIPNPFWYRKKTPALVHQFSKGYMLLLRYK